MQAEPCFLITVDGPSASGKSTVSCAVAERLGFVYVDSGSLYRGITWKVLREGIATDDLREISYLLDHVDLAFFLEGNAVKFTIDGEHPGDQLRSEPVRENVSTLAAIGQVRVFIVARLREMTRFGNLVMEGRDIGSVVFPESEFKYYLDASAEERAKRRYGELRERQDAEGVDQVMSSLRRRDAIDSTRKVNPLQIPLGAKVIDSTSMNLEQVVELILEDIRNKEQRS